MSRVLLNPPNAILFVLDPTNKDVIIPPYSDGVLTAASATCVSVGTQADVDGETEVSLEITGSTFENLRLVFSGAITVPGGKVAVVTSHFDRVLEIEVPVDTVEISIWADDLHSPARIAVGVKPLSTIV